jgi:hypothetical protein
VRSDDLSDAPVPDRVRLARCTLSRLDGGGLELWGPPAGILSLARWLRAPTDDVVDLAGPRRDGGAPGPGALALVVEGDGAGVAIEASGDRCDLRGDAAALTALAEVVETVGVHALDLRWAPVERRHRVGAAKATGGGDEADGEGDDAALLAPGSPDLTIASAYPLDPVEDAPTG